MSRVWSEECKVQSVKCGASPIDTTTPQENQRLETRHVGAEKRPFRTRLPPILVFSTRYQTGCNVTKCHACHAKRQDNLLGNIRKGHVFQLPPCFKIDVFRRFFLRTWKFATSKSMFRARLPSIFSTRQKMPRLPQNLHLVTTRRSPTNDLQKTRNRTRLKVLRLPQKMTMDTSKVLRLPRKLQHIFWKRHKSIAPATQNDFQTHCETRLNVPKCHACRVKRSNDTSETSKNDHLCRTSHQHGHTGIARTVASGCGRLRSWTQRRANTPSTPRPPEWNGNPCYAFGKKHYNIIFSADVWGDYVWKNPQTQRNVCELGKSPSMQTTRILNYDTSIW